MEIAIVAGLFSVIAALVGYVGKQQFFNKPKLEPNPHPDNTRMNDLAASYWIREFDRVRETIHDGFERMEGCFEDIEKVLKEIKNAQR